MREDTYIIPRANLQIFLPYFQLLPMASQLKLKLHLESTYSPAILDLEGTIPYDIVLQVRRGATDLTRSMNILTNESLFDIPYAFSTGLKLIDLENSDQVDLSFLAATSKPTAKPTIITLQPRKTSPLPLFQYDVVIPLQISTYLKPVLILGHEYRVELATVDIGVKWWNYGDDANPELPPERANLAVLNAAHRDLSVVTPLPRPPSISVSMSLSSDVLHRSKSPPTTIRVAITNHSDHAITIQSSGDQSFLSPQVGAESPPSMHRITSINPSPSLSNFSITKFTSSEEFVAEPKHRCSLTVGSWGRSK